ncbi:DUF2807 domain-containing protein [Marinilabiliaceae bacterium JC040]|nr:DUF2807 domain-containing protein [Marinilabiliaceae bacterium JC040]
MKRIFVLIIIVAALVFTYFKFNDVEVSFNGDDLISISNEYDEGELLKKELNLKDFSNLDLRAKVQIELIQDSEQKVRLFYSENIKDRFEIKVINSVLKLRVDNDDWLSSNPKYKLKLVIHTPNINKIKNKGACSISSKDIFKTKELKIYNGGALSFKMKLDIKRFFIDCSGASKFNLSGKAEYVKINCSGAAKYSAYDMIVKKMTLNSSGASSFNVNVSESLNGSVDGISVVKYKGSPDMDIDCSGLSKISPY